MLFERSKIGREGYFRKETINVQWCVCRVCKWNYVWRRGCCQRRWTVCQDIFPVVTFVIYYGEEEWKYETTLLKRLMVKVALKKYVSDYKIHIYCLALTY